VPEPEMPEAATKSDSERFQWYHDKHMSFLQWLGITVEASVTSGLAIRTLYVVIGVVQEEYEAFAKALLQYGASNTLSIFRSCYNSRSSVEYTMKVHGNEELKRSSVIVNFSLGQCFLGKQMHKEMKKVSVSKSMRKIPYDWDNWLGLPKRYVACKF